MSTPTRSADAVLEKGLPAAAGLEETILGSILATGEGFDTVRQTLSAEDFSTEGHRRIFKAISGVHERGDRVDVATVAQALDSAGQLESITGLYAMQDGMPALINLDTYVRIVSEKSTLRRLVFACRDLIDRCCSEQNPPGELLQEGEAILRGLGSRIAAKGNLASAGEIVSELNLNQLGKTMEGGVRTPYAALNRNIAGFREGELIVLGARPSAGKTAMAVEIALHATEAGHTSAVFSLEMRKQALITRAACNRGQIDRNKLDYARLSEVERLDFVRALQSIAGLPLHIDDRAHTFSAMAQEVRRMKQKPRLMVVDHLHLMRVGARSENRNNELAQITRDLKLFAGEFNLTVLLLAQLSRASEKENRSPEMRDLRDCGSIEADADVVLFLHRKQETTTEAEKGKPIAVDLRIAKQREGQAFIKLPMLLIGAQYRFQEAA
jgi:replicative DNA helicase